MANKVYADKSGIIRNDYEGDQTRDSVREVADETQRLTDQLRQAGRSVFIIVDLSKLGASTADARRGSNHALKQFDFDKMALFGANVFMKTVATLIVTAAGLGHRVKFFNTENEALRWLR